MAPIAARNAARPRNVTRAVAILCIVLAYDLLSGLTSMVPRTAPGHVDPLALVEVGYGLDITGAIINAFLIYNIFNGNNWARIIYVAFYVFGGVLIILGDIAYHDHQAHLVHAITILVVRAGAVALLFTRSGRGWFARHDERP